MPSPAMYSFIIEEVSKASERILNQAIIFAHDEVDALRRHLSMYPDANENDVSFRVFPHVQHIQYAVRR